MVVSSHLSHSGTALHNLKLARKPLEVMCCACTCTLINGRARAGCVWPQFSDGRHGFFDSSNAVVSELSVFDQAPRFPAMRNINALNVSTT